MTPNEYDFRRDPTKWVQNDASFQGALVRTKVFTTPMDGDKALINEKIDSIFAQQEPEGYLGDAEDRVTGTAGILLDAVVFGASADRPEVKLAVELVLKHPQGDHLKTGAGVSTVSLRSEPCTSTGSLIPGQADELPTRRSHAS